MSDTTKIPKGEQTRQSILDAAKALFIAQGFTAASMRQIAQAVGITPAAIYNHFASKDEIFTAVLQQAAPFDETSDLFEAREAETLEDMIYRMVQGMVTLLLNREDYIQLGLIDAQERDGATIVTFLPQLFPSFVRFYERMTDADARQQRLRQIPAPILMRTLISLIFGFIITERVGRPTATLNLPDMDWVQGLVDIFMHGVLKSAEETVYGDSHSN
ncbi:MAG: TetR/AcrR family transcriptional regulator [Chloroflexota bacterium]